MFYFAFGAEILWTACVTSIYVPFCKISENMISRMFKQGVHLNFFRNALTKINGRIHWGSLITLQKSLLTLLLNNVGSFFGLGVRDSHTQILHLMATCQLNRSKNQITCFHKMQETSAGNLRTYSSNNCELKWYSNDCKTRAKHHEKVQLEWGKNSKVFYKRNLTK